MKKNQKNNGMSKFQKAVNKLRKEGFLNKPKGSEGRATIIMTFDIHGTEELNRITDKIRQIDGVLDIQRTTG